jgi:DNA-binding NarL/FixJ family response regulator
METKKITVLCVDDNADICQMMSTAINSQPDMTCVGALHDACSVPAEATKLNPQIILLDLTMPGSNPLEVIAQLRDIQPDSRVIAFSGYDDVETVNQVMDVGAWGFISKHEDLQKIFATIRQVAVGEVAYGGR